MPVKSNDNGGETWSAVKAEENVEGYDGGRLLHAHINSETFRQMSGLQDIVVTT